MRQKAIALNASNIARGVRIIIGLVILATVFVGPRSPLGWWGLFPLVSGILGGCPGSACSVGGASCATRPARPVRPVRPAGDGSAEPSSSIR